MTQPPANWYPDPEDPAKQRYWDGSTWTRETRAHPGIVDSGTTAVPEPRRGRLALALAGVALIGALAIAAYALGRSGSDGNLAGEVLWSTDGTDSFLADADDDVLLFAGGDAARAIDRATGELLWEADAGPFPTPLLTDGVAILGRSGATTAIDSRTGAELWERERMLLFVATSAGILGDVRDGVTMLDTRTGEVLWSNPGRLYAVIEGLVVIQTIETRSITYMALALETGEEVWDQPSEPIETISIARPRLLDDQISLGVVIVADEQDFIGLDRNDGTVKWTTPIPGRVDAVTSTIVNLDTMTMLTCVESASTSVQMTALEDGEVLWAKGFDPFPDVGAPTLIGFTNTALIVGETIGGIPNSPCRRTGASAGSIAAFDLEDGERLWRASAPGDQRTLARPSYERGTGAEPGLLRGITLINQDGDALYIDASSGETLAQSSGESTSIRTWWQHFGDEVIEIRPATFDIAETTFSTLAGDEIVAIDDRVQWVLWIDGVAYVLTEDELIAID